MGRLILKRAVILWLGSVLLIYASLSAQNFYFERIGTQQGLSHNSVTSIVQDSMGIVWFGTRNGLNRYDGNKITAYYAERGRANSLPENQIKTLEVEGDKLWVQTFGHLSCFDLTYEIFTNHSVPGIKSFELDTGFVWVGTSDGLYRLDTERWKLTPLPIGMSMETQYNALMRSGNQMYIGTQSGLYLYDVYGISPPRGLIPNIMVTSIYRDSKGRVWVGTLNDGVFCIENSVINRFRSDVISHNFVRCIVEDDNGDIWLGTLTGLDRMKEGLSENVSHYNYNEKDPTQISHSSVWALCKDRHGAIWVGTFFGGVNVFQPTQNRFRYYNVDNQNNMGLGFRVVSKMCEDPGGNLWIGTEGGGLNVMEHDTERFTYYIHRGNDPTSIACNNVKSLALGGDSVMWVATHTGGLNYIDLHSRRFVSLRNTPQHRKWISSNNIGQIAPMDEQYVLATHNGVIRFDPRTKKLEPLLPDSLHRYIHNNVLAVAVDGNDVWIGTEQLGLACYNVATREFRNYTFDAENARTISSNMINNIFIDRHKRVWIATANGLDRFVRSTDDFEHFSSADGMPSNMVLDMIDSEFGDLIVTTNRGVSLFYYKERRFVNFTFENGLPLDEVNANGLFRSSEGELFLGGFNGMASFYERDLIRDLPKNSIKITELSINNRIVSPQDDDKVLSRSIMLTKRIDLRPEHSLVTISFSDMGLTKTQRRKLCYTMDGLDTGWQTADASGRVSFTNLPSGDYTLRVRYEAEPDNPQGECVMRIVVHPPFYLSVWAILIYIVVLTYVVFYINRMYLLRKRALYELSMQEAEYRREDEHKEQKLRFFTNVSHELRTPLTLITGQLEYMLESRTLPNAIYQRILSVFKNAARLQSLTNELLDFRKQETDYGNLHVSSSDFNDFIQEIYACYVELAAHSRIDYRLESGSAEPIMMWFDRPLMEKVFYNLLSNAFKFTQQGEIAVSVTQDAQSVAVKIKDSGIGISLDSLDKIFDSFYQAENSYSHNRVQNGGTGLGLSLTKKIVEAHKGEISVESELGQGTVFIVMLLKGDAHFEAGQKLEQATQQQVEPEQQLLRDVALNPDAGYERKYSVLVVEDNDEMREFLCEVLSPFYFVETACDGEQGLEMSSRLQPNLVLSDVMMPRMSGTQMCVELKSRFETSHIPVVLLTARTAAEHTVEGLEVGADDYIAKPASIKLLVARIGNVIQNRLLLQEKFMKDPYWFSEKIAVNEMDAKFMDKAVDCIKRNMDNANYAVADFATDMLLGRTSLFSKIKGITGQTPNDFIISQRIKYAVELLHTRPDISIAEVADRSGFTSPQYFSTIFKKHYGVSPLQYMQKRAAGEL